ncbi:kinase-like domain-containing protein [Xylogone sp. PMI_703]|nr:kinase-like domain-containing protein [Xylogone sp. PMI_703]
MGPQTNTGSDSHRKSRFKSLPNGKHEHSLAGVRNEVTPSDILRSIIITRWQKQHFYSSGKDAIEKPIQDKTIIAERYGEGTESIGYGRSGNVKLLRKININNNEVELYALKEHRRAPHESVRSYRNRSTSGFCIASCLRHANVIKILDLIEDQNNSYFEVMAFCDGGSLANLVLRSKKLEEPEANCFFKQLARGVEYLHSVGVAHRDLKPENLLLTATGVLKIADFGEAECFRLPWQEDARKSHGRSGTIPYMAPEQLLLGGFDSRMVDIWAMGIIYMVMRTGKLLWDSALKGGDSNYSRYLEDRQLHSGFQPIEHLRYEDCRNVIYAILHPVPKHRLIASQILASRWCHSIQLCDACTKEYRNTL